MKPAQAICIHTDKCGGCSLQHLPEQEYYENKIEILQKILARLGAESNILSDIVKIAPYSRRRAEFKIAANKDEISLGFCEEKSNRVVDISMCKIVMPEIFALGQKFKTFLSGVKKAGNFSAINITYVNGKFDVFVITKNTIKPADKTALVTFAEENNIDRLAIKCGDAELEILYKNQEVQAQFGNALVDLPLGAFLQATQTGQHAITNFILRHLRGSKNVVDLYSGCGTYSFPLAENGAHVTAYEGDYEMVFALNAAARKNDLEQNLQAQSRDLYKKPLRVDELAPYDAIVINPPRNGALPQCQQIAKSGVKKIVMVSCNPATFERDAQCLLSSGYNLHEVVPIDQFLWSNHLELVAYFDK